MHRNYTNTNTNRRISINDLFDFIKKNVYVVNSLGYVDLNDTKRNIKTTELHKLEFQDVQKISYLPPQLSQIFNIQHDKYLHAGCLKTCSELPKDISLYSSIMTCLKQPFLSLMVTEQDFFISRLLIKLRKEAIKKYELFGYKLYEWSKNTLETAVTNLESGVNVLKYLSDYFHINIFICDIEKDILQFTGGTVFIPYKKNIFLLKFNDGTFEPLYMDHTRTLSVNDKLIKKLINNLSLITPTNIEKLAEPSIIIIDEPLLKYKPKVATCYPRLTREDYINECKKALKQDIVVNKNDKLNAFIEENNQDFTNATTKCKSIPDDIASISISSKSSKTSETSSSVLSIIAKKPAIKKKNVPSISSKSSESSDSELVAKSKVQLATMKQTVNELTLMAKKYGVSLKDKNGKNKTKAILIADINSQIN